MKSMKINMKSKKINENQDNINELKINTEIKKDPLNFDNY